MIGNIFQKLRYDGETLFLVAGEPTENLGGVIDRKIQKSRPMMKIDTDMEINIEPSLIRLPIEKRVVVSSLQRIE